MHQVLICGYFSSLEVLFQICMIILLVLYSSIISASFYFIYLSKLNIFLNIWCITSPSSEAFVGVSFSAYFFLQVLIHSALFPCKFCGFLTMHCSISLEFYLWGFEALENLNVLLRITSDHFTFFTWGF